jgi:hypothetical protein
MHERYINRAPPPREIGPKNALSDNREPTPQEQKFFASFLQKRSAFSLPKD